MEKVTIVSFMYAFETLSLWLVTSELRGYISNSNLSKRGQNPPKRDGLQGFLSVGTLKDKWNNCMLLQFVYSSFFLLGSFMAFSMLKLELVVPSLKCQKCCCCTQNS